MLAAAAIALTGCLALGDPAARARLALTPPAVPAAPATAPSAESAALAAYYTRIAQTLRDRGLLRTDQSPIDAPFTASQLAENFISVAMYDEYVANSGLLLQQKNPSVLRRWDQTVRISIQHGASTSESQRIADRAELAAYVDRLARVARHPIRIDDQNPNFTILVLDEDERRNAAARLRRVVPGISATDVAAIVNLPRDTFCAVFAFSDATGRGYSQAVAVLRAEHPPALRTLCLQEELAQGLGLANDGPIRPSIFNDDEEFAVLTRHDEMLLAMLYDARLSPGMTEAEVRPIAQQIAAALVGGES